MINFYIVIPTYNRNDILNDAIRSVFEQSYPHWNLLISDNASEIPVEETIPLKYKKDPRVKIIRRNFLNTGTKHAELLYHEALNVDFDYLLMLADDDLLFPFALETIEKYCENHLFIGSNFVTYYQKSGLITYEKIGNPSKFIFEYNSISLIGHYTKMHGITVKSLENESKKISIGPTHVSSYFINKKLLKEAYLKYGKIHVTPFGDVGYGKFTLLAGSVLYIAIPLAIIRINNNYGMMGSMPGYRHFLARHHDVDFKYSPLQGLTFANCSLESYLSLLEEIDMGYDKKIDIIFFIRHLYEILMDKHYNITTWNDFKETLPFFLSISVLRLPLILIKHIYNKIFVGNRNLTKIEVNSVEDIINLGKKKFNSFEKEEIE